VSERRARIGFPATGRTPEPPGRKPATQSLFASVPTTRRRFADRTSLSMKCSHSPVLRPAQVPDTHAVTNPSRPFSLQRSPWRTTLLRMRGLPLGRFIRTMFVLFAAAVGPAASVAHGIAHQQSAHGHHIVGGSTTAVDDESGAPDGISDLTKHPGLHLLDSWTCAQKGLLFLRAEAIECSFASAGRASVPDAGERHRRPAPIALQNRSRAPPL